jgi:hypothetical protein
MQSSSLGLAMHDLKSSALTLSSSVNTLGGGGGGDEDVEEDFDHVFHLDLTAPPRY